MYQLPAPCHHAAAAAAAARPRRRGRHEPRGLHRAALPRAVRPVRGPARLQGSAPGVMCCPGGVGNYKLHGLTSKKGFYHLCLLPFPPAARKTVKQRGTYTMYQIGSLLLHCLDTHKLEQTETLNKHQHISHSFIALLRLLKNNECDGFSTYLGRSDKIS